MSNLVAGLDALTALTSLVLRVAQAQQEVSALVAKAQAEDRDLTDEEISAIQAKRQRAVDEFNAL